MLRKKNEDSYIFQYSFNTVVWANNFGRTSKHPIIFFMKGTIFQWNIQVEDLPSINFLFPCTISFPATFTREKFSSFPIFTTWLQFSTFLNGIFMGGLVACFQLTDPGETLSRTSKRTHLHGEVVNFNKFQQNVNSIEKVKRILTHFSHPQIHYWHM